MRPKRRVKKKDFIDCTLGNKVTWLANEEVGRRGTWETTNREGQRLSVAPVAAAAYVLFHRKSTFFVSMFGYSTCTQTSASTLDRLFAKPGVYLCAILAGLCAVSRKERRPLRPTSYYSLPREQNRTLKSLLLRFGCAEYIKTAYSNLGYKTLYGLHITTCSK